MQMRAQDFKLGGKASVMPLCTIRKRCPFTVASAL